MNPCETRLGGATIVTRDGVNSIDGVKLCHWIAHSVCL